MKKLALFGLLVACSSEMSGDTGAGASGGAGMDAGGTVGVSDASGRETIPGADTALPPEEEETFDLRTPSASRSFVFVANSTLNTVAKIDSVSLGVTPIEVCLVPTEVQTLPTIERAVVLCEGDDQLGVIDPGDSEDEVRFAWVAENANRLILSPHGDYALAWYDERFAEPNDHPGNPHDLTLLHLGDEGDEPRSYLLSVGFGIRTIQFDSAGNFAFVTTEDGLNAVELAAVDHDQFVPLLSLGEDPLARAADREVLVTDDGALAFVRTSSFSGLRVLNLDSGEMSDIELPGVPTDLDLFPGGERGIAVLREISTVAMLPLPAAVEDPELIELLEIPDEVVGLAQLSPSVERALLYSTAIPNDHITMVDLESYGYTTFALRKPVAGVAMAPSAERAIIFHTSIGGTPVPGEPLESFIAKSWGFSLFDMASGFARLVTSPTEPDAVVFTEDGLQAFVMLEDAAQDVREIQWVHFDSFRVETLEMARPPEAIGVVPATGRVYVSQLANTGRITFIDTQTGTQRHVTAYQLNRRIE